MAGDGRFMTTPTGSDISEPADPHSDLAEAINRKARRRRPILVIGSVLMAWACFLGVGAVLASDDYLKALVIIGVMACFISVWMAALWLRNSQP